MPRRNGMGPPWWTGKFRGYGCRVTVPRQVILQSLNKASKHLSAEEIYLSVHKVYPAIGLTTVYRTLELLVQMGLVFKFDIGDGKARYKLLEGPKGSRHLHHLVCTNCGRVIEYTNSTDKDLLSQTEKTLSKKYNFKIANHLVQFHGLCGECQNGGKF